MPPRDKGNGKTTVSESRNGTSASQSQPQPSPTTVAQRSRQRIFFTDPGAERVPEDGLSVLSLEERRAYIHSRLILPVADFRVPLSGKAQREFWKTVSREGLSSRRLEHNYDWGTDRGGRDLSSYELKDFEKRRLLQAQLTAQDILHRRFLASREVAARTGTQLACEEFEKERERRKEMAALKRNLYGEITTSLAKDPDWDDVTPIPQKEAEDALARIAYPEDYAEAVSYLRAVMASEECSPRCLRLTDLVISMNPAHYTVWLYRFRIVSQLKIPVREELEWLNQVSLAHLKNYQIWHHRQLLMDCHYPSIAADEEAVKALANSEVAFLSIMLAEDKKNYHVWSYRQYLVAKLGLWNASEVSATEGLIEDDVRNNSAWSHRFFVVFSDPTVCTPDLASTAHDAKVPSSIIEREIAYAQEKILLAPQNQSGWNYLRGVLAKGGRGLATMADFARQFVSGLGEGEGKEQVESSHALDLLSEAYMEQQDLAQARLCLQRLWEKWDPIREGYWKYRALQLSPAG